MQEQQAMQKILAMIAKDKRFTATVHPLKVYDKDFILQNYPDSDITNSWKALNAEFALGGQYEWLALLCKQLGIQAELGLEYSERGKANRAISTWGGVKRIAENLQMIDIAQSRKEIVDIFRFYELGITELSKRDMYKISMRSGLYKIMKHT